MNSASYGYGGQNYDSGYQYVKETQGNEGWKGGEMRQQGAQLPLPPNASQPSQPIPQHGSFMLSSLHMLSVAFVLVAILMLSVVNDFSYFLSVTGKS